MTAVPEPQLTLRDISRCFEGAIPAIIATASATGTPNITSLSRVLMVDDDHVALSNQFFSKTARNLAENRKASLLVIDPTNRDEYRLTVTFERTERRGPVFEQLREEVDVIAGMSGMQDVFKLRAADLYRVLYIDRCMRQSPGHAADSNGEPPSPSDARMPERVADVLARLTRCPDLDTTVDTAVDSLVEFGYEHCSLHLINEDGRRLYTIGSRGYPTEGVGSEVAVGEGTVGMAAARATTIRLGNLYQLARYSASVKHAFEDPGGIGPGREIPVPGLTHTQSRLAVPGLSLGQVVCVLVAESSQPVAFDANDEAVLTMIASVLANVIEADAARASSEPEHATPAPARITTEPDAPPLHVRFFPVDGSTFLDGDYLIKGVAGRVLWSMLRQYERERRVDFTTKELRLDPTLDLPDFRDNLDNRLMLLKRRLDERDALVRIEKTGRGRCRIIVNAGLRLDDAPAPP